MARTSKKSLEGLFDAFADLLAKQLEDGRTVVTKDGEVVQIDPDAATLNVVRQFLKEQGIEADGDNGNNERLNHLRNVVPFKADEAEEDLANEA